MAGGGIVANGTNKDYPGKLTSFVLFSCLVASCGGLIFGYDIGISGGVTSMDSFLIKFFPNVYHKEKEDKTTNQYCKFNSQLLTTFTSSLYLAALVSSFFASSVTRKFGRKWSMFGGGMTFLVGSAVNGFAMNVEMLIIGRIFLGIGIGFANQSVPVYLSEMAPARLRGRLNISFQMMTTIGILVANMINYGTANISGGWGWRLSLGLAAVPACMITFGALALPDTPNSLIERGHAEQAKAQLIKIRGTQDIKVEYEDMVMASEEAKLVKHPWRNIMMRKNRPQLIMAIMIPFFQQITGINIIMFYAPVLFKTIGFGADASLMSAVITGLINVFATTISIIVVDKFGRKILFLEGGVQMIASMIVVGVMIMNKFGSTGVADNLQKWYGDVIVGFISTFVSAFAWSWGPLGWLVPSEIFPLEIRSAGQCITVAVNMLFTFIIAQAFLPLLCILKYGLFFMFAGFVAVMTVFICLFMPETKNVPIEEMTYVWKKHWFWGRFIDEDDKAVAV